MTTQQPAPNATQPQPTGPSKDTIRKATIGGAAGMFVEFFDYSIYGFLAAYIAHAFFTGSETLVLISTYSAFALTFLLRPIGGFVLGLMADRWGRRPVLVLSLVLMTLAVAAIGLLPTYQTIGIAAPILLVLLRLVQGFSAGGEVGAAMTFVGEYAPGHRRAFYVSWVQVGSFCSMILGTTLAWGLLRMLGEPTMQDWGWRIPFLLAVPLGLVGYWIRRYLDDTPEFVEFKEKAAGPQDSERPKLTSGVGLRALLLALTIPLLNSSGYYVLFVYMPTYLCTTLKYSQEHSLLLTAIAVAILVVCLPLAAGLADRFGRRPVLVGSAIGMAIAAVPCYALMATGSFGMTVIAAGILAVLFSGHSGVVHAALIELFPTSVRNTGYAIGYNINTALVGGAGPLLVTWLIAQTGSPSVPAWYVVITALGTAVASWFVAGRSQMRMHA